MARYKKIADMIPESEIEFSVDTGVTNPNSEATEVSVEAEDGGYETEIESETENVVSDEQVEAIVRGEIEDAVDYVDNDISPERALAGQYYKGEPFGNEEEGRSQVISMDVRDTVQAIMPSIMRVFFSSQKVVEFAPNGPEDVGQAEQATDYVNYILTRDNNFFTFCWSVFKDALIRKNGIGKVWWDKEKTVKSYHLTGLDETAYAVIAADPDVEITEIEAKQDEVVDPETGAAMLSPPVYDLKITRTMHKGRVNIAPLPPEEFLIDRRARSIDEAAFVAHRRYVTVSELVAMGYEEDEVADLGYETSDDFMGNMEAFDRNPNAFVTNLSRTDVASRKVLYIEAYLYIDCDGDGIAELRRVCVGGSAYKLLHNEPADFKPFVDFCPDPEPHTFFGMSVADVVMDIQQIKSAILRNTLDSLAQSINPRVGVVEGQVNLEDVMNTEVGGVIRMRQAGAVQPFAMPFVGQQAFPMLQYMDEIRENRTGISKAASGLDANALQSSTKAAVAATITAAQQHIELICRIFAETGMRSLFSKVLKLIVTHQDAPRMVRLSNKFVPVDPRPWDADMDVVANVALGTGSSEEKLAFLAQIAAKQEQILQTVGVENPLVTLAQYRNTLAQMLALAGFKDPAQFFLDPATVPPQPPAPPKPSPEEMLAQVQVKAIEADIAKKAADLELEREKMRLQDDRERDKLDAELMLKAAEIEAKYGTEVNTATINAMMERDREYLRQNGAIAQAQMAPPPSPTMPE